MPAAAQVTASFALQPPEVFKAAYGSKPKGVGLWEATLCNNGPAGLTIHSGRIFQAAQTNITTVNATLVGATVNRAKRRSKAYLITRIIEYGLLSSGIAGASGKIAMSDQWKLGLAIATAAADKLSHDLDGYQIPLDERQYLSGTIVLAPAACDSRLLLGSSPPGVTAFSVAIP